MSRRGRRSRCRAVDEHGHAPTRVGAADADVVEAGPGGAASPNRSCPPCRGAGADPSILITRRSGSAFSRASIDRSGVRRPMPSMGTDVVVVGDEAVDGPLELLLGLEALLGGQELLQGLVEALDLAAGLGMVGPGVLDRDAEGEQLVLDRPGDAVAALRGEDEPVVGEERGRIAPGLGRFVQHPDHVGGLDHAP